MQTLLHKPSDQSPSHLNLDHDMAALKKRGGMLPENEINFENKWTKLRNKRDERNYNSRLKFDNLPTPKTAAGHC